MTKQRAVLLGAGILLEFVAVIIILLKVIPGPRKETDYLVIGTLATFAALGTLFGVLLAGYQKDPSAFRKKKDDSSTPAS